MNKQMLGDIKLLLTRKLYLYLLGFKGLEVAMHTFRGGKQSSILPNNEP